MQDNWFETWFDSPYYHILYRNRNEKEAAFFLHRLFQYLELPPHARVADIPCGKGRHAIYLNSLGYDVTGLDLSPASIDAAKAFENEHLHFAVHDMRQVYKSDYFDCIFNLFTSFAYFDEQGNREALSAWHQGLKQDGVLVIDFLNAEKVLQELVPYAEYQMEGIHFEVSKQVDGKRVIKQIRVRDGNKSFQFMENVALLGLSDFEKLLDENNFRISCLFGNYALDSFDKNESERLIIKAHKKA